MASKCNQVPKKVTDDPDYRPEGEHCEACGRRLPDRDGTWMCLRCGLFYYNACFTPKERRALICRECSR